MPEEETISFEVIRNIQREEQASATLTKLPKNFYEKVGEYLRRKKALQKKKEDRKSFIEIRNVERLIEDIFNRRERKILNQALITVRTNIPPENLTEEEKEFFEKIVSFLKDRRKMVLDRIIKVTPKKETQLLVFKEDVPEFVGIDMKTYGPFKKGDIAKLPEENAKLLIESGKAEVMKMEV
jgi:DNA replication factor GINS